MSGGKKSQDLQEDFSFSRSGINGNFVPALGWEGGRVVQQRDTYLRSVTHLQGYFCTQHDNIPPNSLLRGSVKRKEDVFVRPPKP